MSKIDFKLRINNSNYLFIIFPAFAAASSTITTMTQCNEDQFFLTNPGGPVPPVICGLNTGAHGNNFT